VKYSNPAGTPVKLVRVAEMCLNETYNEVRMGAICLIHFLFRMVLNKECCIATAFQLCFRLHH
jgi:hypothetical protein